MKRRLAPAWQWLQAQDYGRVIVMGQSALLIGTLLVPSWLVHRYYFLNSTSIPLSLAISFLSVIIAMVLGQLYVSCVLKFRTTVRARRSLTARAKIMQMLAGHIGGTDHTADLRAAGRERPKDLETCMTRVLLSVKGDSLSRLRELVDAVGLLAVWQKGLDGGEQTRKQSIEFLGLLEAPKCLPAFERALSDGSPLVRAAALRSIIRLAKAQGNPDMARIPALAEMPFVVQLFAAAETRPVAPAPETSLATLLQLDTEAPAASAPNLLQLLDALIASGDSELAALSAETLGSLVTGQLRGETA